MRIDRPQPTGQSQENTSDICTIVWAAAMDAAIQPGTRMSVQQASGILHYCLITMILTTYSTFGIFPKHKIIHSRNIKLLPVYKYSV